MEYFDSTHDEAKRRGIESVEAEYLRNCVDQFRHVPSLKGNVSLIEIARSLEPYQPSRDDKSKTTATQGEKNQDSSKPKPISLPLAMDQNRHLILLGEPGIGKSATLQYIALCIANEGVINEELQHRSEKRIPIFFKLKGKQELFISGKIDEILTRVVQEVFVNKEEVQIKDTVRYWLENENRLIFLIDGLDEVREQKDEVIKKIQGFANSDFGRSSQIIVSSRVSGYTKVGDPFREFQLLPLSETGDMEKLLKGWLSEQPSGNYQNGSEISFNVLDYINARPALKMIVGNPLLLQMAAHIKPESTFRTISDLFEDVVTGLIEDANRRSEISDSTFSNVDIFLALEIMAQGMQIEGIKKQTEFEGPLKKQGNFQSPKAIMAFMSQKVGLIRIYNSEVEYFHDRFRDYFLAKYISDHWKDLEKKFWRYIKPRLHSGSWQEPIKLLLSMLDEKDATRLMLRIINAKSEFENELHRDLILAGECLSYGARIENTLLKSILVKLFELCLLEKENKRYGSGNSDKENVNEKQDGKKDLDLHSSSALEVFIKLKAQFEAEIKNIVKDEIKVVLSSKTGHKSFISTTTLRTFLYSTIYAPSDGIFFARNEENFREAVKVLGLHLVLPFIFLGVLPKSIREKKENRRYALFEVINELKLTDLDLEEAVLTELRNEESQYPSIDSLGITGSLKTAQDLFEILMLGYWPYRDREEATINTIGRIGQRDPQVVRWLKEIIGTNRNVNTINKKVVFACFSLIKVAETDPEVFTFVAHLLQDFSHVEVTDDHGQNMHESLSRGAYYFNSATQGVVRTIIALMRKTYEGHYIELGKSFLSVLDELFSNLRTEPPFILCKAPRENGEYFIEAVDFSDEILKLLCERPDLCVRQGKLLRIFVRWGMKQPELIKKIIECYGLGDPILLYSKVEREKIPDLQYDEIATIDPQLRYRIDCSKREVLYSLYSALKGIYENGYESSLDLFDPVVVAALACFRDLHDINNWSYLFEDFSLDSALSQLANKAIGILANPGDNVTEVLWPIWVQDGRRFITFETKPTFRSSDHAQSFIEWMNNPYKGRDIIEYKVATSALAKWSSRDNNLQDSLINSIEDEMIEDKLDYKECRIESIRRIQNANGNVAQFILENYGNAGFYGALNDLVSAQPEAISAMIAKYKSMRVNGENTSLLGEILGCIWRSKDSLQNSVNDENIRRFLLEALSSKNIDVAWKSAEILTKFLANNENEFNNLYNRIIRSPLSAVISDQLAVRIEKDPEELRIKRLSRLAINIQRFSYRPYVSGYFSVFSSEFSKKDETTNLRDIADRLTNAHVSNFINRLDLIQEVEKAEKRRRSSGQILDWVINALIAAIIPMILGLLFDKLSLIPENLFPYAILILVVLFLSILIVVFKFRKK